MPIEQNILLVDDLKNLCIAKAMELFFKEVSRSEIPFNGTGYFCRITKVNSAGLQLWTVDGRLWSFASSYPN